MASQAPAGNAPNVPDPFTPLQQLVSRIDSESRAQEVIDKATDLNVEEQQLLVDVLSTILNKSKILSQRHAHTWSALIKIASSARVFARNRTIRSEYIATGSDTSACIKVVRQIQDDTSAMCSEKLVEWAHLSHPNILPLYAVFLESEDSPSFVSLSPSTVKICDHVQGLTSDQRLPLILDVVNGLCHLHQLNIVHGGLGPETILVSVEGRALITNLDVASEEEDSSVLPIRYSAPELSLEDSRPTKATDIWALGCLGHEVLSGKVPFCQCSSDFKAISAIARGDKPARPGPDGPGGIAISDVTWDLLMMCWEYEAVDRPTSSKFHEMLSRMHSGDGRPEPRSIIEPEAIKSSIIDIELAKTILSQILGSHQQASVQVPKHLRDTLSRLVRDSGALSAAQVAAKKLNRDDTQTLVDLIELVVKDLPYLPKSDLTGQLVRNIIRSAGIFPQYYRASGIRYDSDRLVSDGHLGKIYAGRGLKVRVLVTKSSVLGIIDNLALWAHASHPNILPFHGVFHENLTESPQFCVVLPHLKNGTLEDYAPTLPQKSRMLLISDVASGLAYLQNVMGQVLPDILTTKAVVISDEGRALVVSFYANYAFFPEMTYEPWRVYVWHFYKSGPGDHFYSFGCLCYQVLSRKLPYYQVPDEQVESKVYRGDERLMRPDHTDVEMDEIDDKAWELITKCCAQDPEDRPDWSQIQEMLANMEIEEDCRPPATPLPIPEVQALRSRPEVDMDRAEIALSQAEVLHGPLSELIENHTKDVAMAVVEFEHDEIQTIVNFLDQALKERLTITEERNRVLAILSRITSSTLIFPQRYELKGIKYDPRKRLAEGGCGIVYRGADPTICVKLMKRFDTGTLALLSQTVFLQENVLISNEGRGLITDFGTSHVNTATTATGSLSLTTLRFSAPETVLGNRIPTKKFDIWSLSCLLYEVLSRKPPYYQYKSEVQIIAALTRKEMPKRPGSIGDNDAEKDEYGWDDDIEEDYDAIDDQMWSLIVKCCAPELEARPDIASVQELVVDLKIHDDRPTVKDAPGVNILKSRVNPKIDLTRVEELFNQIKGKLAASAKTESTAE
ncbi:Tyrosine-protein kinase CSK [Leucoagaricus sp. SymC.cos]|nr:Tyrosine-protein kinase CSK [Leucoagaricus sp. SymC.cos]